MPEFVADLLAGDFVEIGIPLIAIAAVDWGWVASDLFIALTGIGRSQFVKAF
jgi:hypothetical protein